MLSFEKLALFLVLKLKKLALNNSNELNKKIKACQNLTKAKVACIDKH